MTRRERRQIAAARVEQYLPLIQRLTGRWSRDYPWLADDFRSDSLLALWQAALEWEPDCGANLLTFCWSRIRWALIRRLNYERAKNRVAFLPQIARAGRDHDHLDLRDPLLVVDDAPPVGADTDEDDAVDRLLSPLSAEQRRLVMRRVLDGAGWPDLEREYGVNRERVREQYVEATRTLREAASAS